MKRRFRFPLIALLAALAAVTGWDLLFLQAALAQQQPPTAAQSAAEGGDGIEARMQRLEERIRDMQAVIGTLQSFVRDGGSAAGPGALPQTGGDPATGGNGAPSEVSIRVLALETQVRALTGQMKEVIEQLDQAGAPAPTGAPAVTGAPAGDPQHWQQGQEPWQQAQVPSQYPQEPPEQGGGQPYPGAAPPQQQSGGNEQFASAAQPDPQFGSSGADTQQAPTFPWLQQTEPQQQEQTAQVPGLSGLSGAAGGARGIYDASYQSFVRNDLNAAEQGFSNFVASYPDDPLVTNAYYWLGRAQFQQQKFEPAAKSFLAGYKKDKQSAIAPDSLLHLGLSLAKLGETEAACSTLGAIEKQYPDAPARLRDEASEAVKNARC